MQGQAPTKTEQINEMARVHNASCAKYYMVNFAADLVCADEEGTLVATTLVSTQLNDTVSSTGINHTTLHPMHIYDTYCALCLPRGCSHTKNSNTACNLLQSLISRREGF